jgi:L-ribulokinase
VGAACLAAVAAGWFPDVEAAATHLIRLGDRIYQPDPAVADIYQEAYRRYRATFDALEPTYTP